MMKPIVMNMIVCGLFLFSATAFSNRFLIVGKPIELSFHQGFYSFPASYRAPVGYHFITLNNTNRICYLDKKSQLESLDRLTLVLEEHGNKLQWNCYQYDPNYFEIDF